MAVHDAAMFRGQASAMPMIALPVIFLFGLLAGCAPRRDAPWDGHGLRGQSPGPALFRQRDIANHPGN
jgi:hypothetical protein